MNDPDLQSHQDLPLADTLITSPDAPLDPMRRDYSSMWKTLGLEEAEAQRPGSTISPERLRRSQELRSLVHELPLLGASRVGGPTRGDLSVLSTIGQGGMGVVFLATQRSVGREVAVKAVREDRRGDHARQGLLCEGWIAGRLEHPNIVPIHALGVDEDGFPMLVMKRIEGVTWSDALADPSRIPPPLVRQTPLDTHLEILRQLCQAVHFAHSRHILHRDLKPDNVMLGTFGEVYLVDWGVAVCMVDDGTGQLPLLADARQVAGTPSYMAPELAAGDPAKQGPATDIYLLGAILHEVLTGLPRHEGDALYAVMMRAYVSTPHAYPAHIPAELAALANAACAREPGERPASAEALRQALLLYERHAQAQALSDEAWQRFEALRATPPGHAEQVYRGFGAARFGFEQALREWPEGTRAAEGLRALCVWMVGFELDQERAEAAAALLDELGEEAPPALVERLDAQRVLLQERAEEMGRLQRLDHEVDVEVSSEARGQVMLLLAAIWFVLPLIVRALDHLKHWPLDYPIFSALQLAMDVLMLGVLYAYRGPLMRNQANRRMVYLLLFVFVMSFSTRHIAWLVGISIPHAAVCELLVYATACFNLAATIDRRVWPSGAFYLVFAAVVGLLPAYTLELMALGNAAAMIAMGKAWDKTVLGCDEIVLRG
jgi:eukaryotic-like serine/threonine-protein kinase